MSKSTMVGLMETSVSRHAQSAMESIIRAAPYEGCSGVLRTIRGVASGRGGRDAARARDGRMRISRELDRA